MTLSWYLTKAYLTRFFALLVGLGRSTENGEFVIALPRLD